MKGIVFNLLGDLVTSRYGAETWDTLLDHAAVDGAYTSLGNYSDTELTKLVAAAATALNQPPESIVRWFGREALPVLAAQYPHFFSPHRDTRAFLLTLNGIIHPEVRKLYPGAETPEFEFTSETDGALTMVYRSSRRLCSFAEGLIEGAAAHYGQEIRIDHAACMHRGDSACHLRLIFVSTAP